MAKNNTPNQQLYDMLVSKDFDLTLLDNAGRPSTDPSDTKIFSFDYTPSSMHDYGTIVIMLTDDKELEVYTADNVGKRMDSNDKKEWFDFLQQLRMFAKRNLLSFGIRNLNHLKYSMQGQAAIKEGLNESWNGNKTVSYNDKPNFARLMIKHSRPIREGDVRYRHIDSLFLETDDGERFKLPFKSLMGGRAMVEHIRSGGKPYDIKGQHIEKIVNELNVMGRFKRSDTTKIFENDNEIMLEKVNAYYESTKKTLKSLGSRRGYKQYFESWNPTEISEEELVVEDIKHLFVTQNIDSRIEDALPILVRIQQQEMKMKEIQIFESWVNILAEGVWACPDTKEKQSKLAEILSNPLRVGPDATNASAQLYDLYNDDELSDKLHALAEQDANADCRNLIVEHLQEVTEYPGVSSVLEKLSSGNNKPELNEEDECVCEEGDDDCDCHDKKELDENKVNDNESLTESFAYDSTLAEILRKAGVGNQDEPSIDYEDGLAKYIEQPGVNEEEDDDCGSESNPGVAPEHLLDEEGAEEEGAELGINRIKELSGMPITSETEETDEGAIGSTLGGIAGGIGGAKLGSMAGNALTGGSTLGSVAGSLIGGALGAYGGSKVGDKIGDMIDPDEPTDQDEQTDEGIKGGMAGAIAGGVATKTPQGAMQGYAIGDKIGDGVGNLDLSRLKELSGFLIK